MKWRFSGISLFPLLFTRSGKRQRKIAVSTMLKADLSADYAFPRQKFSTRHPDVAKPTKRPFFGGSIPIRPAMAPNIPALSLPSISVAAQSLPPALPSTPRPARRDCHGRLVAALLAKAGPEADMVSASFRGWCSATFVGAQHEIVLRMAGEDAMGRATALAEALPDAEFRLPGHLVAELAVDAVHDDGAEGARLVLAALTIEDW